MAELINQLAFLRRKRRETGLGKVCGAQDWRFKPDSSANRENRKCRNLGQLRTYGRGETLTNGPGILRGELGLDRLVMIAAGATKISEVLAFPIARA